MARYDAVVIGAGHNGLTTAAYLARCGLSVLVVERRELVGGSCVTEELAPGAKFSTCASVVSCLRPEVILELELEHFGLHLYAPAAQAMAVNHAGASFFMFPELDRSVRALDKLCSGDGDGLVDFGLRLRRFASFVTPHLLREPPLLSELIGSFEAAGEVDLYHEFVDLSVASLVSRYFRHDLTRGLFAYLALGSFFGGPYAPGSAYGLSHHAWGEFRGEFGRSAFARGGMGAVSEALAASARAAGATIRTTTPVAQILVDRGRAVGVMFEDGTEIEAAVVVSNVDPKATFGALLDERDVPPDVRESYRQIDVRGTQARILVLASELPAYEDLSTRDGLEHQTVALLGPGLDAFQNCWEHQRRGELAADYPLEVLIQSVTDDSLAPPGLHTISIGVQHLPYELASGTWETRRDEFTNLILGSLYSYAPNLEHAVEHTWTITPLDLEREYGLSGGNVYQGAMVPVQRFRSRPFPGAQGYRTRIPGLYLCGAGTHPGGGVMGAAGHNAAFSVLEDWRSAGARVPLSSQPRARPGGDFAERVAYRFVRSRALRGVRHWAVRRASLRRVIRRASRLHR